jgi:hypothetical protein
MNDSSEKSYPLLKAVVQIFLNLFGNIVARALVRHATCDNRFHFVQKNKLERLQTSDIAFGSLVADAV